MFSIVSLCIISITVFAQEITPKMSLGLHLSSASNININIEGVSDVIESGDNLGVQFDLNSFSSDLVLRKYKSNQSAIRLALGTSSFNYKVNSNTTYSDGGSTVLEGYFKQSRINLTPALERYFRSNRFELFAGLGLPVSLIGKTKASLKTTEILVGPSSTEVQEDSFEVAGGFGIGFQSLGGFNFYIIDKFSVGTEITYGIGYTRSGGKSTIISNDNGTIDSTSGNLKMNGFRMTPLNGALVLTLKF